MIDRYHNVIKDPHIIPLQRMINRTLQDIDKYEWDGEFQLADHYRVLLKELKQREERGEIWYPLF